MKDTQRIAIIGGGPSGLFMFKRLIDTQSTHFVIDIFERKNQLGAGLPYSSDGANDEHVTNVSGNEIPELVTPLSDWITSLPKDTLDKYHINPKKFNDYKVLPRLLFGQYLTAQFGLLQQQAKEAGITYNVYYNQPVADIIDYPAHGIVQVQAGDQKYDYEQVIICTGHCWPKRHEVLYPATLTRPTRRPKLGFKVNHMVAIRGASLTAVDAIRTLTRHNGQYVKNAAGNLMYQLAAGSEGFKIMLHSRKGMLPAVRFHLEDSHLSNKSLLTEAEIMAHIAANDGFLSLDYIFEKDFKDIFRDKKPVFYERIKDMNVEEFVAAMMELREEVDPFKLMQAEYAEAERSIKQKRSVYWKEMLGVLSFAMNYPAKHFSAEGHAKAAKGTVTLNIYCYCYIPQSSCDELLALHAAGLLELVAVGDTSKVETVKEGGVIYHYTDDKGQLVAPYFKTFVDCIGQPHLSYDDLPFKSLVENKTVTQARLPFKSKEIAIAELENENHDVIADRDGSYYLKVPGITINDNFQVVDEYGALNERIYIMAVPYIAGYNPDYSGLDFCEKASLNIIKTILPANEHSASPLINHKLFMVLLGSKAPARNIEQHDFFFGIATSLKELVPQIKAFWPEAGNSIHVDGWREVNSIDNHQIRVVLKQDADESSAKKLFFINLGGYRANVLEEQHYTVLGVYDDRADAVKEAKRTVFFKTNTIKGANSHIDEKYGIDVDDIYRIEDILSAAQKERYHILITPAAGLPDDEIHLGYFKLDKIR